MAAIFLTCTYERVSLLIHNMVVLAWLILLFQKLLAGKHTEWQLGNHLPDKVAWNAGVTLQDRQLYLNFTGKAYHCKLCQHTEHLGEQLTSLHC